MNPEKLYWSLFAFAGLSFLTTLPIQYVGEESIYPLMSYEMWFRGKYLTPVMYGTYYWRPPLYNLMIIPAAQLIGWDHMLVAARLITLTATLLSALLLGWFAKRLTRDATFGIFAALCYLTFGDVLFYGGWLSYSDPVFALFVLSSMIFGWLALAEKRYTWLAVALPALNAAFLSKVLTAYVFYGVAMLVVAYRKRCWAFLFSRRSLILHGLALGFPLLWYSVVPAGDFQSRAMLGDITLKLVPKSAWNYLGQVFTFPLQTLRQFLPAAGVLIYAYWRRRDLGRWRENPDIVTALLIALANYLPYWLSPQSGMRYLMPLYPFAGLGLAYVLFYGAPKVRQWSVKWIAVAIALKFVCGLWFFPYYYERRRGSFNEVARDIVQTVGRHPLYATDVTASGISTVAHIDRLIYPKAPVVWPPERFSSGFVISHEPDQTIGAPCKKYRAGGHTVYLLCRGEACSGRF